MTAPTAPALIVNTEFDITGMTCAACARRVERAVSRIDGVTATVNYATERALVTGGTDAVSVIETIEAAGFGARVHNAEDDTWSRRATEIRIVSLRRRMITAALLTVPLMDITIVFALVPGWRFPGWEWLCVLLALPIVSWAAWPFHRATLRNLRHGGVSMDTLVSLGVSVSFVWAIATLVLGIDGPSSWLGFGVVPDGADAMYLDVAAGMTTLQLAGRYFETRSRRKAGDVLGALSRLAAREVRVVRDGTDVIEPVGRLRVGDVFVALPGETIAADGIVIEGSAAVDTSTMTGEPVPTETTVGDDVVGGAISTDGFLRIRATSVGANTRLAQMAALAERAQARKANVQTLADRVTSVFVPGVIVIALLTAAGWIAAGASLQQAIGTGIAVVIIACPCALGLATPTALMVGVGRGAALGILIKGQEALEASGRITTVVFDKTGTLTTGRMSVEDVSVFGPVGPSEVLRLAAAVEQGSEHPLARAISSAAGERGIAPAAFEGFVAEPGRGASAIVEDRRILVGNRRLLTEHGIAIDPEIDAVLAEAGRRGSTAVLVARAGEGGDDEPAILGTVLVADTRRTDAATVIAELHARGFETVLLTGDHRAAAASIASAVGIGDIHAESLPAEKAEVIAALRESGRRVAMVGDGINDAVALAAADLGIAVASGTDIALKSADLILVRDDLAAVADALALSRRTLRTIRVNLAWAFGYNVAAIPLAASGLLNPLIAAATMSLSSMLVIQNSLRLRSFRPHPLPMIEASSVEASGSRPTP